MYRNGLRGIGRHKIITMGLALGVLGFLTPVLSGCGSGNGTVETPFAYAGTFSGPWNFTSLAPTTIPNQQGTMTATISSSGQINGTLVNNTFQDTGTLTGMVDHGGHVTGTYTSLGQVNQASGTLSRTSSGALSGTFTVSALRGSNYVPFGTVTFTLPQQAE